MSTVRFREALKSDVPAMARLRAAHWGTEEYWRERIPAYMECRLHPQKALMPRIVYVVSEGDCVIGLIAGHLTRRYDCDGELEWIDVVPERRGSGVASELLRLLAEWFIKQKALRVCVDVQPDNAIARRFYTLHGAIELNAHWMVWNDIRAAVRNAG